MKFDSKKLTKSITALERNIEELEKIKMTANYHDGKIIDKIIKERQEYLDNAKNLRRFIP